MRGQGLRRYVLSMWAWETTVNGAVNAAINMGATTESAEYAFDRYINDQASRGLAWLGFTQLIRERVAKMQQDARTQAETAPAPEEPKPETEHERNHRLMLGTSTLAEPCGAYGQVWYMVSLADPAGNRTPPRRAETHEEANAIVRELQAEYLAARLAEEDAAAEDAKPAKSSDALRAVDGMTGVYSYTLADDSERFAAKWPGDTAGSTKTKRGFDTADEAAAYRTEQTTSTEALAA